MSFIKYTRGGDYDESNSFQIWSGGGSPYDVGVSVDSSGYFRRIDFLGDFELDDENGNPLSADNGIYADYSDDDTENIFLTGGNKGDVLYGSLISHNVINGGAGNDVIRGRADANPGIENDSLDGGDGIDTLDFSYRSSAVSVDMTTGLVNNATRISNIENVIGTDYADTFVGDDKANTFRLGSSGDDGVDMALGGAGNDHFIVGNGDSKIFGGSGIDSVVIEGGANLTVIDNPDLMLNPANYVAYVESIERYVVKDTGTLNLFNIESGGQTIITRGAAGIDETRGEVQGTKFADTFKIGGDQFLDGDAGNDRFVYTGAGSLAIAGGEGSDTLVVHNVASTTFDEYAMNGVERMILKGTTGSVDLSALTQGMRIIDQTNAGVSVIGTARGDFIHGGAGDDFLAGGGGSDKLWGGAGADTFALAYNSERDQIMDFASGDGDKIDVTALGSDFSFIDAARFSGTGVAEIRAVQKTDGIFVVSFDTDGDGSADASVVVHSSVALQGTDFIASQSTDFIM